MSEPSEAAKARHGFRRDVKTLTDRAAKDVRFTPLWTYVRTLVALPVPDPPPRRDTPRIEPWEFRTFVTPVRMLRARSKGDGDIHLIAGDLDDDQLTMVTELPSVRVGRRRKSTRCTRRFFECRFGDPPFSPDWLELNGRRANLYGVAFFDASHAAQAAPNGIELHPVIGLSLVTHHSDADRPDELAAALAPTRGQAARVGGRSRD
jgi:hypothetical protein